MFKDANETDRALETDIAIVGAGPVGLMFANLLGAVGVQVIVLERNAGLLGLPRAIAYDAETLRLFAQVGLFGEISSGLVCNPPVRHLNARARPLMEADAPARSLYGHSALGTFYQPEFERTLLKGLARFANVRVLFEHRLEVLEQDANEVALTIATPSGQRLLRAQYIVGCDGGTSGVRDMIGARLVGSTYAERWLVVDAIVKGHDVGQITFDCDPRRPRVELPAVGDRVRWEFMQLPGETEEELNNEAKIRLLVQDYKKYRAFQIERSAIYTFHARVADRWRRERIFLAGDAAHLMPPFAGQGMNGGMKDAVNLAWKVAAVLKGQAQEAILDTYEVERAPVVRHIVEVSRRLGAVIMPTNPIIAAARDLLFAGLNLSGRFRTFVRRAGFLPPPRVRQSALTARGRDPLIGQMMPQPEVGPAARRGLLDAHLTCHQWLALGVGVDPVSQVSPHDLQILDSLGARFLCLNGSAKDARTTAHPYADSEFEAWAKRHRVRAVLVRPDRFIAARLDPDADLSVLAPFSVAPALRPAFAA
jgi:3-(3-hydroxy-phenyl)propionate hydroxylase